MSDKPTAWHQDTDARSNERDALIEKLRERVKSWEHNTDDAWVKVKLGEVRALFEEWDLLVDYTDDMALDHAVEDRD